METTIERIQVIAHSAVTYLVAASVAVTVFATDVAAAGPEGSETASAWALRVAAWLTGAVGIIRQVSPVPADERGLLDPYRDV